MHAVFRFEVFFPAVFRFTKMTQIVITPLAGRNLSENGDLTNPKSNFVMIGL